jgi:prepilin-type N-terminal cleavage/methylation domain-containing protein
MLVIQKGRVAGYTLLELMIAVTISGVVAVGILKIGFAVAASQRIERLVEGMSLLVGAVNDMYAGKTNYASLDTETAIRLGLLAYERVEFPSSTSASLASQWLAFHTFGQQMSLKALDHAGFNAEAWGLHYTRLPAEVCMEVTQSALTMATAVAIVSDPISGSSPTSVESWAQLLGPLKWENAEVKNFPTTYEVLKTKKSTVPSISRVADACQIAVTAKRTSFSLAMVLRKM